MVAAVSMIDRSVLAEAASPPATCRVRDSTREQSVHGVGGLRLVELSPRLVAGVRERGDGAKAGSILGGEIGAKRQWIGDERAQEREIVQVSLRSGVAANGGRFDHDRAEEVGSGHEGTARPPMSTQSRS